MFFHKNRNSEKKNAKENVLAYNAEAEKPVVRCSICTGEQVAGFRNLSTGEFREAVLIRTPEDLETFKKACGVRKIENIY
ncbi:MAG: aspartate dehydrogenase [Eubacterium sp.]|nr:aspartate dehydrogenase [Eubacterium sp.]